MQAITPKQFTWTGKYNDTFLLQAGNIFTDGKEGFSARLTNRDAIEKGLK